MTVLYVHPFPSCLRSKCARGCKGEGLNLGKEGSNRVPVVPRSRIAGPRFQNEKGPERWARIGSLC